MSKGETYYFCSPGVPSHSSCSVHGESPDRLNHPSPPLSVRRPGRAGSLRERRSGRRRLEASAVFFWPKLRPDSSASFGAKNKNIWSEALAARAHLLFVITCAPGPVYILLSVSTGVFIRNSVPSTPNNPPRPSPDLDMESNKAC